MCSYCVDTSALSNIRSRLESDGSSKYVELGLALALAFSLSLGYQVS